MEIIRGTTPTISINILDEDINFEDISVIWINIAQNGKDVVDKATEDIEYDETYNQILVHLSQTDTLKLNPGSGLLQLRILLNDDTALASKPIKFNVVGVLKEGYIK